MAGTRDHRAQLRGRGAVRWVSEHRPPGPFSPSQWRSPLRGPWLTSVLGSVLAFGLPVVFVTGLVSYAAYLPGRPCNDRTPGAGLLRAVEVWGWPTSPSWLYRATQGTHVLLGLVLVPVILAKLWSVIPRLFVWPPVRSLAHTAERISLAFLVGGIGFELATGVLNVQDWYVFPGSFYALHLYGAWVFMAALVVHIALKAPTAVNSLRSRSWRDELRTDTLHTVAEDAGPGAERTGDSGGGDASLVSPDPSPATLSRRGLLGTVALSSLTLLLLAAGQVVGGPLRSLALLAPRGRQDGSGPHDFPINKRAAEVGVTAADVGPAWRLTVTGPTTSVALSRATLLAMPQATADLPIACVEGWSSGNQRWSGVRLRDLAALAGLPGPCLLRAGSLQASGSFRAVSFSAGQVGADDSLLALRVNGADLSLDHGYPARVIIPAAPGVHCTKWVSAMSFATSADELGTV